MYKHIKDCNLDKKHQDSGTEIMRDWMLGPSQAQVDKIFRTIFSTTL